MLFQVILVFYPKTDSPQTFRGNYGFQRILWEKTAISVSSDISLQTVRMQVTILLTAQCLGFSLILPHPLFLFYLDFSLRYRRLNEKKCVFYSPQVGLLCTRTVSCTGDQIWVEQTPQEWMIHSRILIHKYLKNILKFSKNSNKKTAYIDTYLLVVTNFMLHSFQ